MARTANRGAAIRSVKKRIVPVGEAMPYVNVLVYGRNGKGKTRFAATAPKPIIADINEHGTQSVRNYPGVDVFHVKNWADLTYFYWYLREGDHKYQSVILDTITQAQAMCLKHVLKEAEDRDPNRPPAMPDRRTWGQMGELLKPVLLNFRNLPMNTVFVAQERVDRGSEEDEDATTRIVPDLSPGVRGTAMASVSVMGRIYQGRRRIGKGKKEKVVWETRMLVGPHEDYETKDRTGALGTIVRNPTMDMVIEANASNPDESEEA